MAEFGTIESTLFVPMAGRIYASEKFPGILHDPDALALKDRIPSELLDMGRQSQYIFLASASRSANMDRVVGGFLSREPDGVVVELGCGLETTFGRDDDGHAHWYAIDLPDVIEYRRSVLPEPERQRYLAADAFDPSWVDVVRSEHPGAPILAIASGLLYYFPTQKVVGLLRELAARGNVEIAFDAVSKAGLAMMNKKYMKEMGHEDAQMYFSVDSAAELAQAIGAAAVIADEPFYRHISRQGLRLSTRLNMTVSDLLTMVRLVHLALGEQPQR